MAVVLKNKNINIYLDSNVINGIVTDNSKLLSFDDKKNVFYISDVDNFYTNDVLCEMKLYYQKNDILDIVKLLFKKLNVSNSFIERKISDLSSGEKKILKYILMLLDNKRIIVIDEPFRDLDYSNKKIINSLMDEIIRLSRKTIIIVSNDSNVLYSICKKVVFINSNEYIYGDITLFHNKDILNKYHIDEPLIVKFVNYAKKKNILIDYSNDIRDLMKDVYKSV